MKFAVASLLSLTVALSLFAQEPPPVRTKVVSIEGERTFPLPINGHAVGFALQHAESQVAIAARLGNGGGRAYLDAFLMKRIGPGTTEEDEIARISLDLPYPYDDWVTLFADLELERGSYWLVIAKPHDRAFSSINWFVANPQQLVGSCGAIAYLGTRSYTFFGDAAEYIPASKFEKKYAAAYGVQFEVTSVRAEKEDCASRFTFARTSE